MKATRRRPGITVSLPMLLALGGCDDADQDHSWSVDVNAEDMFLLPAMTFSARDGIAVLAVNDDEVVFESVPYKGSATFTKALTNSDVETTVKEGNVSYSADASNETIVVSIGEHRCTLTRGAEAVEFDGRRADLAGGAKRAVFTKEGGLEVSDRE